MGAVAPYTLHTNHYCGVHNYKMQNIEDNTRELCEACITGNIEGVEEILSNKEVDINGRDNVGDTPLMCAADNGHLNIVRRLLQHPEMDVNAPGRIGFTPLMIAVVCNYLAIVRTLLDVPALQLGRCSNYGCTALHAACFYNRVPIMKLFCQDSRCSPGVVNKKNIYGDTALMKAIKYGGHLDIVKELDKEGTDFFIKDRDGTTLIEMAREEDRNARRKRNKAEVLKYLIERPKVDTLKVIVAHNIARYVRNKAVVETLEIPVRLRKLLAGFVDDDQ